MLPVCVCEDVHRDVDALQQLPQLIIAPQQPLIRQCAMHRIMPMVEINLISICLRNAYQDSHQHHDYLNICHFALMSGLKFSS